MNMCAECCNKIVIHYYYYYVEDRETSGYSGKKDLFYNLPPVFTFSPEPLFNPAE